ncbi:cysteine--tRNA ligase [Candidatus Parcubacteria bacterium]|nr:cysteine--tRNA ligase [Candidatus Parcubacteria bacterium]
MTLKLYDTYTRKIRDFKSIQKNKITMYNCGPTVYDFVHIGNYRTYLMADFIRRTFEYFNYDVKQIKNITDVGHLTQDDIEAGEDKMLKAARRENKSPYDIARFYENIFLADEKKLNILPAYKFTRATEYINEMIAMIEKLIEKDYAYESNGNVFFAVGKFENYGKLSGNTLENLKTGSRLEAHPDKRDSHDFALWLKASPDHLMQWDSPWSKGYPGWHIECSAMSTANLGNTIDIHTGGEDNIFPHHEDEIAQSEGATGKKFVNYWLHGRHLLVDGKKMSKSKGNFYKLSDIEKKGLEPLSFRYLCLTTHFQSQLNFTWQSLEASQSALNKLFEFVRSAKEKRGKIIKEYEAKFNNALENNLDTPRALAITWEMIKSKNHSIGDKKITLLKFDDFFGFDLNTATIEDEIPAEIERLTEQRNEARKNKDWSMSDKLRAEIESKGFILKDTTENTTVKPK